MKVALTSAAGSIGFHIPTELHKHGHKVIALIRDYAQWTSPRPAAPRRS